MRYFLASISGLAVTFALFFIMSLLVSQGKANLIKAEKTPPLELFRPKPNDEIITKDRRLPKKPPPVDTPPPVPQLNMQAPNPDAGSLDFDVPNLGGVNFDGGIGFQIRDTDIIPLVRIEPQYPRKAAMNGIEGWVELSFTITPLGTTTDIKIIGAKPKRMFNQSARRALSRWKYKPKVVDGKPVSRYNNKVHIDFKLAK